MVQVRQIKAALARLFLQHGFAVRRASGLARAAQGSWLSGRRGYIERRIAEQECGHWPAARILPNPPNGAYGAPPLGWSLELRVIVYVLLAIAVATTAISFIGPSIDLAIAGLFYDPATRRFVAVNNPYLIPLRGMARSRFRPASDRDPGVAAHAAVATARRSAAQRDRADAQLDHRPGHPGERHPEAIQRPAATDRGDAVRRRSEIRRLVEPDRRLRQQLLVHVGRRHDRSLDVRTGHAGAAAWRGLAIGAAAVFATAIGLLRMAAGAHFFTDILIGALATILIILAVNRLDRRRERIRPDHSPGA